MEGVFPDVIPDEIGRECLLRVPFKFHEKLRKVCKSWEAVANSPQFYPDRKRLKTCTEQYVFVITQDHHGIFSNGFKLSAYDPVEDKWAVSLSSIPKKAGLPTPVAVNEKLFMIGRSDHFTPLSSKDVFAYDLSLQKWNFQIAHMPTPRYRCACSASPEGLIYIAGGGRIRPGNGFDGGAAVYNVEENKWEALPDMNSPMDYSQGAFVDGKFYVKSLSDNHVEVFDTNTQIWTTLEWSEAWFSGCLVSAFGKLYSFKREGVMEYDCNKNVWRQVDALPNTIAQVHCATVWGDQIFLSGRARKPWDTEYCYGDTFVFYMYRPPKNWITINGPASLCDFSVLLGATLTI